MKTNGNNPVSWSQFDIHTTNNLTGEITGYHPGLMKREYFAALAMQSNVGNIYEYKENAERAVKQADALIAALNQNQASEKEEL